MKLVRVSPIAVIGLFAAMFVSSNGQDKTASLADDKVLGKVIDVQGITSIRPPLYDRWTPACVNLPLKPGDWLRTDVRGANALHVRLANKSGSDPWPGLAG